MSLHKLSTTVWEKRENTFCQSIFPLLRKIYVVCVAGILYHDKRKKSIIILKTHKQTILSVLCHPERSATRWSAVELLRVEQSEQAKARSEATQGSARDNSELLECECYFYISSAEIRPLTAVALRVSTPLHSAQDDTAGRRLFLFAFNGFDCIGDKTYLYCRDRAS